MPPLPPAPSLPVAHGAHRFEVRRILCIGRNYAAHAVEMGGDARELPFHFGKSVHALLVADPHAELRYPPATHDLQHEVELVVALAAGGRDLSPDTALEAVFGYAVGLDMTRRDLQKAAKGKGRPWEAGKDFDGSAVCGALHPVHEVGHPRQAPITLTVNGEPRQAGNLDQMTWKVPELLAHLSSLMTLHPGDVVFTGTPAGVGPVVPGDHMEATIEGLGSLTVTVTTAQP